MYNNKYKKKDKEKIEEEIYKIEIKTLGKIKKLSKEEVEKSKKKIKKSIKKKYNYKNKILIERYLNSIFENIDIEKPIENEYFLAKSILIEKICEAENKKYKKRKNVKETIKKNKKNAKKIIEEIEKENAISNRWNLTEVLKNEIKNILEEIKESNEQKENLEKKEHIEKLITKELSYKEIILKVKPREKKLLNYVINL